MVILALDVGSRRIGVAVSDPTGLLASSRPVIHRKSLAQAWQAGAPAVQREAAEQVLVGLPLTLDGEVGPQARETLVFIDHLKPLLAVPIATWDERYTTVEAAGILRSQGVRYHRQRERIDSAAAAVLLQHYLDTQRTVTAGQGHAP